MANRGGRPARACVLIILCTVVAAVARARTDETNRLRDGFESDRVAWRIEKNDAEVRLFAHDRSARVVREGKVAEHFQFEAGPGGDGFYVSYPLPKITVTDDLKVSLQARSERPGLQLLARVILPADLDPDTGKPSFVMVAGSTLQAGEHWERLELRDLIRGIEQQARVLRASSRRKVDIEGAYLDRLVVNLYGGPGATEVYLDDLAVEPVEPATASAFAKAVRARGSGEMPPLPDAAPAEAAATTDGKPASTIAMNRNLLSRRGYPWLPTVIRAPHGDPIKLRRAGFDVLAVPADADADAIKGVAETGLALMPEIDPGREGVGLEAGPLRRAVESFPSANSVAFWSLGRGLGSTISLEARKRERQRAAEAAQQIRQMKASSGLVAGEVAGFFPQYARVPDHLNILFARPAGWGTTQELLEMFAYLQQRRDMTTLDNTDGLIGAWLDLAPDPAFSRATWGLDRPAPYAVPRVTPEQLRLMTFAALAAGCRAVGYDADIDLTHGAGRALLIESAILNEEVDLVEWLLADPERSAQMIPAYPPDLDKVPVAQGLGTAMNRYSRKLEMKPHPSIKVAAFGSKDKRGVLLLIVDMAAYSQYQASEVPIKDLTIDVPGLPDEAIAYEISPGDVPALDRKRTPGGLKIKVPEFGGTAIVYVTTDGARVAELQRAVYGNRAPAVNLLIEQVQLIQQQALEIHRLLLEDGHPITDAEVPKLLSEAEASFKAAQEARERLDFAEAWFQARRARRGYTNLMRLHWENAQAQFIKLLTDRKAPNGPTPLPGFEEPPIRHFSVAAVPPLTSYATLPQAYVWKDWIARGKLGANLLPGGNFEDPEGLAAAGWLDEGYESEGTKPDFVIIPEKAGKQFRRYLKLSGTPEDKKRGVDALSPFLDHPVAAIRTPPIKVYEGELIRIAVQIDMPYPCIPGAGGVFVRDSIGGEALQFRTTSPLAGWQEVVLYRRAPADGELTVLLGYGGHQDAKFDNLRIQKVVSSPKDSPVAAEPEPARRPTRRR